MWRSEVWGCVGEGVGGWARVLFLDEGGGGLWEVVGCVGVGGGVFWEGERRVL